jgi:pyruvate, water dikinase
MALAPAPGKRGREGRAPLARPRWAQDGLTGEIFIVQARPETVEARRAADVIERFILEEHGEILAHGKSVGQRIGAGRAHVILDPTHLESFQTGEVLVVETTTPD